MISTVWDQQRLIEALRASELLGELTDAQISRLAGRAHFEQRKVGDMLVKKDDPSHQFYFICEGQVRIVDQVNGRSKVEGYLYSGDFAGALAFVHDGRQPRTEEIAVDAVLATFDQDTFSWLRSIAPALIQTLQEWERFLASADEPHFAGQRFNEAIVDKTGRHIVAFIAALPGALLLLIAGLTAGYLLIKLLDITAYIISGCLVTLGLLTILYVYLDWRNDEFILTSERAIHIERILLHGETRQEAPLTSIQDVSVIVPGFLAKLFDYSDLHIQTAGAGTIVFDGLRIADTFRDEIFRQRRRAQERGEASDINSVRRTLGEIMAPEAGSDVETSSNRTQETVPPGSGIKLPPFIDFFIPRVKEVQGNTITWRKNYLVFLNLVLGPLLVGFGLTYLILAALLALFPFDRASLSWAVLLAIAWLLNLVWYSYQYDTWRKDEYQVTLSSIIDYKGSAFNLRGEARRVGTFDVIQNSTYLIPNFGAKMLNIGHVVIETAGTEMTFTFEWVYNPVEVQQEIFKRWLAYKESQLKQERAYEEQRLVRWLGEFYRMMNDG